MAKLFHASTVDGAELFESDTPAEFRNQVCDWLEANPGARLIEEDKRRHPAPAFPFTAWRRVFNETRGSMHVTREQAINAKD